MTADQCVDVLLEYLEAMIHQVLFSRRLYPTESFERQRLYGIAVQRARHPELTHYVARAVAGLKVRGWFLF
jgi:mitotic spindle assembly checkpoint protein MAD2B